MEEDFDDDLVAFLIPSDRHGYAAKAFRLPHNRRWYSPPEPINNRESTPLSTSTMSETDTEEIHDVSHPSESHRIRLGFDNLPPGGLSFGSDPACDIHLGGIDHAKRISGVHFCITYNEQGHLILEDKGGNGTAVSYNE